MLTEVCDFVHNYFELMYVNDTFEIADGTISLDFLKPGQRFRIVGSALNDGIYTYYDGGVIFDDDGKTGVTLATETFTGTVVAMGGQKFSAFLKIVQEISDWQTANKAVLDSPLTSESFGGYSWTKASGSGANSGGTLTWQDKFDSRLKAYRKIA